MKINTLKRSVALAMGLGLAGAVTSLATLAQPPVDDPTEHLLEIGQNEDTMEDTDIAGPPLDPRANILGYPTPLGPDWSDLFRADHGYKDVNPANGIPDYKDYGAIIATFVRDDLVGESISTSPKIIGDRTIFSGTNKNDDPIDTYEWKGGSVPAKDDVSNGYFMADRNSDGDLIIYGGFERIANNGDSHIDIEFNQSEIGLTINGVAVDPAMMSDPSWQGCPKNATCVFTGARQAGDILVSMDFLRGGDFGTAEIHVWQGDAATGSWTSVHALDGEGCNPDNTYPAGAICAFNNNDDIDGGPWENFDSHGAVTTIIPRNGFTEGGMNVSELVGGGTIPCISSVTVKTRSSQSFTAELKDFVLGSFEVCGQLTVVKQATGQDGTPTFNYSGTGGVGSFSLSPTISGGTGSASTSFDQVSPGPITITETDASGFGSSTNANCVYSGTATTVPGGTYQPNSVSFPLDTGDDITCTFYNTQPTLKVTKTVTSCATEASTFGLNIDGALKATVSQPGGNTGQHYVTFGTQHTVSETIGNGTTAADWVTAINADCNSSGQVTTSALQAYECTIGNVRKPRVIVNKAICDGTSCTQSSTGFTLQVNGNTVSAGTAVNIEQVGGVFPATVSEVRGAGTYLTTIMCNNGTRGVYDASTTPSLNLGNLQAGDVVTCDIVNAKQTSTNACPTP
ncbi:MAG: prealbumin-like fold domain-containing protein [Pseudomonadota bacterium]